MDHTTNIKKIAKSKGIQIKDLATALEMTKENLSRLINSENPTLKSIEKIAAALNVQPAEILFGVKLEDHQSQEKISCPHCGKPVCIKITLEQ